MNKKGFTLIELLAVIAIIAVVLSLALYGGSLLLTNARKDIYVNNAREYLKAAKIELAKNSKKFALDDPEVTYYIHIDNFTMENDTGSPWGPWKEAYVVVALDSSKNYVYGWASKDVANYTVRTVTEDELSRDDVIYDETDLNLAAPLGARESVVMLDDDGIAGEPTTKATEVTGDEADECFSYELNDTNHTAKITFYKKECGPDVIIPGRIDNYIVTSIHTYSFYNKDLESVLIPEGVTTIGSNAFQTNHLKKVKLPQSLTKIESEAFRGNEIPEVNFTEGVLTKLGDRAFQSNQIRHYEIPNSVTSLGTCVFCNNPIENPGFLYVNGNPSALRGYIGDLSEFPDHVFRIPDENQGVPLKTITVGAFRSLDMTGWTVYIPNSVETIEKDAFWYDHVAQFNIFSDASRSQSHLKTIGQSAFYANDMTTLYIPNSVESIDQLAFNRNKVATGDKFIYKRDAAKGGNHIDYSTIVGYSVINDRNVVIPSSANGVNLTTIAAGAFRYANLRGSIAIPNSVTSIGQLAFALNYLTDVNNGTGDTENAPFVYARDSSKKGGFDKTKILSYGNYGVNTVTVPEGVKELKPYAFYYSNIYHVNLPDSLEKIGSYAFQVCHLTGTVTIPKNVKTIETGAFTKYNTWTNCNGNLTEIVNATNQSFDWKSIISGSEPATFKTGVAKNWYGDVTITKGW